LDAGVADFFAVLLGDGGDSFVFQVDEFGNHLQRVLGALLDAFLATVAQIGIYNYEVFARAIDVTVVHFHFVSLNCPATSNKATLPMRLHLLRLQAWGPSRLPAS
jgi:hypothetical protein